MFPIGPETAVSCLGPCLLLEDLLSSHCLLVAGGSSLAPEGAAETPEDAGGIPSFVSRLSKCAVLTF